MGVHSKLKLDSVKAPKLIDINYYAWLEYTVHTVQDGEHKVIESHYWNCHKRLKTMFNIVEAPFKKNCWTLISLLYDDVQMDQNSQEYKSFEIHAITIKISMTEYHPWINSQAYHLF